MAEYSSRPSGETKVIGTILKVGNLGQFNERQMEVEVEGKTVKRMQYESTIPQDIDLFKTATYGNTDQIINTKVVEIEFQPYYGQDDNVIYSKAALEITKYLDSVVVPYLAQMVPSNAILKITYQKAQN